MQTINIVILLLHPSTSTGIIAWMWWQYGWKKKSLQLKGDQRREGIVNHQKIGERILQFTIATVMLAFAARWYTGIGLLPQSLHGFTGSLGVTLLWIMARWGRSASKDRVARKKHGRAADLLIALMFLHSFLGFLYLFQILR